MDLSGNYLKSFIKIAEVYASFCFFGLYCISSVYLFVFNTTVFEQIGVFTNSYTLAFSCILSVLVGFILFLFAYFVKFRKDRYFLSFSADIEFRAVTFSAILKIIFLYYAVAVRKIFAFVCFLLPSVLLSFFVVHQLSSGISVMILAVLIAADMILALSGFVFSAVYSGRYALTIRQYLLTPDLSVRKIIKESALSMNGKCARLFALKICHIPKKIVSLLILPAVYCLTYCKAAEASLALGKENPYISKKNYTEKPVVFYCIENCSDGSSLRTTRSTFSPP